jgi:hypothetical protein
VVIENAPIRLRFGAARAAMDMAGRASLRWRSVLNLKCERANLSNNRCTGVDATCTFAVRVGESLRADLFKYEEANGAG